MKPILQTQFFHSFSQNRPLYSSSNTCKFGLWLGLGKTGPLSPLHTTEKKAFSHGSLTWQRLAWGRLGLSQKSHWKWFPEWNCEKKPTSSTRLQTYCVATPSVYGTIVTADICGCQAQGLRWWWCQTQPPLKSTQKPSLQHLLLLCIHLLLHLNVEKSCAPKSTVSCESLQ